MGADWAPVQDVKFRASYQRAVRAANVVELFTSQGAGLFDLPGLEGVEEVVISREVVEGTARPLYIYADRSDRAVENASA